MGITSRTGSAALVAVLAVVGLHPPAAHAAADTVAPTITDLGLTAGTAVNGTVTLQPNVSDDVAVTRVQLRANATIVATSTVAPFTLTWDTRAHRNSDVHLNLTAYDAAGNATTSDVVIVYVDNDAPWLVFPWISGGPTSQHPEMSFTGVTPIDFTKHGLAADTAGIELSIGSTVIGTATADPWIINWDTTTYNGPTDLVARGWDHFGNTMTLRGTVWADHTGPTITPESYSPDFITAGGPIRVEAIDGAGIRKTELLINGTVVASDPTPGRYRTFTWPKGIPNGPATMTLRAEDTIGNISERTRAVTVDNDKPVVAVTPANGALVRGTALTAAVNSYTDATGISLLEAGIDGYTVYDHRAPWRVTLDTTSFHDGRHTLTFRAVDMAGNQTYVTRTVTVDNTAPAIRYRQAPKNKAKVTKTFKINSEATDYYGIARVQLLVNDKVVATDTKAAYGFTINPKRYGKKFTVRLRAYDQAGNVKYTAKRTYRRGSVKKTV